MTTTDRRAEKQSWREREVITDCHQALAILLRRELHAEAKILGGMDRVEVLTLAPAQLIRPCRHHWQRDEERGSIIALPAAVMVDDSGEDVLMTLAGYRVKNGREWIEWDVGPRGDDIPETIPEGTIWLTYDPEYDGCTTSLSLTPPNMIRHGDIRPDVVAAHDPNPVALACRTSL